MLQILLDVSKFIHVVVTGCRTQRIVARVICVREGNFAEHRIQVVAIISRLVVRMHLCFGLGRNNKGRCFLRNVAKRLHP